MLQELLLRAESGQPLWMSDLRRSFSAAPERAELTLRLTLWGGAVRDFPCPLPRWHSERERALLRDYLFARVYNTLSVLGGRELCFCFDPSDSGLSALIEELRAHFDEGGYGKVLRIAARIARSRGEAPFRFRTAPFSPPVSAGAGPVGATALPTLLCRAVQSTGERALCGLDVGGSDIKAALSLGDELLFVKECDWDPGASPDAEGVLAPLLLLVRLLRVCLTAHLAGELGGELERCLTAAVPDGELSAAVESAEARYGAALRPLDGIGVSFPDIVLDDRIVGGETPKTAGIRRNRDLDYEAEFARIGALRDALRPLCRAGAPVHLCNDGSMAAVTAALELAVGGETDAIAQGAAAHTLGTDLGTGLLLPDGRVPQLPLEAYCILLDLGSFPSRSLPPQDLRSTRDENSNLPGARRYLGQSAAYRLAADSKIDLLRGFTADEDGCLRIASAPRDLRKPCLEHLMSCAARGDGAAEEIFRAVGEHLAVMSEELAELLPTLPPELFLFGRFVKSPACFALLREGYARRKTGRQLRAADENLANTPLMRQLAEREGVTVAQFGQAIGAIYYTILMELEDET